MDHTLKAYSLLISYHWAIVSTEPAHGTELTLQSSTSSDEESSHSIGAPDLVRSVMPVDSMVQRKHTATPTPDMVEYLVLYSPLHHFPSTGLVTKHSYIYTRI